MKSLLIAITVSSFMLFESVSANNISISNISITGQNVLAGANNSANFSLIKFDVSWENSWRSASLNWDAAWIFVKYRVNGGVWNHCNLNNTGHTAPLGSTINAGLVSPASAFNITTNPAVGAFIYRSSDGSGSLNYQNAYLRWNYGSQGVQDAAIIDVQVFAIEMVYVPAGEFAVGDGSTGGNQFTVTTINTSNSTTTPSGSGSLGGQAGGYPSGQTVPTSSSWPNGFNAFYCMKYEISQGQYRDFLNTLSYNQQVNRTAQSITSIGNMALYNGTSIQNRNSIKVKTSGVQSGTPAIFGCDLDGDNIFDESNDGEWVANNYFSWDDFASFINWCGLRPMSEMEYEKSCRGNLVPVQNEYAWGTSNRNEVTNVINSGSNNEGIASGYSVSSGFGNCVPDGNNPLRVGIISSNIANLGRVTSGSSFYGIMEMTGNIAEFVITLNNSSGRGYLSSHGDGNLNVLGSFNNTDWPSNSTAQGTLIKGGWGDLKPNLEVSYRYIDGSTVYYRAQVTGGRGVRTTL